MQGNTGNVSNAIDVSTLLHCFARTLHKQLFSEPHGTKILIA